MIQAAPAAARVRALALWWSSIACGSGTSTAGRPAQASSAMVEAPARATTRCAVDRRPATSGKKGESSAGTPAAA
jgi:hypothetical protein